jgi:hypothetical protein
VSKPPKVIVHFHKARAAQGLEPWTLHVKGQCIPAREVVFISPAETVFKPHKQTNPRAWVEARGYVTELSPGVWQVKP